MAAAVAFLGLAILSALIGPLYSLECTSQKFSTNRVYSNCSDLPQLGARLHYTYNASNSSLSIAFTAAPASGGAWVAWAINPTSMGMLGSQTVMALKLSDGSVVAKTYNISSYKFIVESKLSFDVWDLTAEATDGTMTVFASVKVPENTTTLNQVWQVGGAVNGTQPTIHPLDTENRASKSMLMVSSDSPGTPAPSSSKSAAIPTYRPSSIGFVSGLAVVIGSVMLS